MDSPQPLNLLTNPYRLRYHLGEDKNEAEKQVADVKPSGLS